MSNKRAQTSASALTIKEHRTMDLSLLVAGAVQMLVAWTFFRLPGRSFLVVTALWRASQSLTPVGVALSVGGFSLIVAGLIVSALATILRSVG